MLDSRFRRLIDPPLDALARRIAGAGITADQLTVAGAVFGIAAAAAIMLGAFAIALVLFAAGRIVDGLDGAVARQSQSTDRGALLDITLDFLVYAAIPLAFAVHDPARNALAAATLLAAFLINGTAFLAFALMAERQKLETTAQGRKSIYYLAGLAGGSETIIAFVAFCLLPSWFPVLAFAFAALCFVSGSARILIAAQRLGKT